MMEKTTKKEEVKNLVAAMGLSPISRFKINVNLNTINEQSTLKDIRLALGKQRAATFAIISGLRDELQNVHDNMFDIIDEFRGLHSDLTEITGTAKDRREEAANKRKDEELNKAKAKAEEEIKIKEENKLKRQKARKAKAKKKKK